MWWQATFLNDTPKHCNVFLCTEPPVQQIAATKTLSSYLRHQRYALWRCQAKQRGSISKNLDHWIREAWLWQLLAGMEEQELDTKQTCKGGCVCGAQAMVLPSRHVCKVAVCCLALVAGWIEMVVLVFAGTKLRSQ